MELEDMIIAHDLIKALQGHHVHHLLDLIEGHPELVPSSSIKVFMSFWGSLNSAWVLITQLLVSFGRS